MGRGHSLGGTCTHTRASKFLPSHKNVSTRRCLFGNRVSVVTKKKEKEAPTVYLVPPKARVHLMARCDGTAISTYAIWGWGGDLLCTLTPVYIVVCCRGNDGFARLPTPTGQERCPAVLGGGV